MNKTDAILINSLKPMYELYHGELSKRHPINLYHEGTDIVIDEYQNDDTVKEISRISDVNINSDLLPSLFLAIYARHRASSDDILRDIIGYVKSKLAFDNYQSFIKTLIK